MLSARAFLFDLDGTLVDSSDAHARAYRAALEEVSRAAAATFVYGPHKGKRTRETFRDLGFTDAAVLDRLTRRKQEEYLAYLAAGAVSVFAGARELLEWLASRRLRAFLVTGASRQSTTAVLERLALGPLLEGTITADDVTRGKPDPEPFAEALRRFGLSSAESVAVEDGAGGVRSAAAAGLRVIGVHDRAAEAAGAELFYETIDELRASLASSPEGSP
ncbi:MAG TPA: HAD family phosphatase [Polyangiaceae bacterium]